MTRSPRERLLDILRACEAVAAHLSREVNDEGMLFDALRMRLLEIGEATKDLPDALTETEPGIPWSMISRTRDQLAHRYFDTTHAFVLGTAFTDVPALEAATRRILASLDRPDSVTHAALQP